MFKEEQKIGLYTLRRKLARGGFGEVWLAEKESEFVTKKVAVKLPHAEQIDFDAIRQEVELWEAASGHPNVLPLIDADVYDGQVALVSEYVDGGSLADRLKAEGRLNFTEAVRLTIGILDGLEYLHSKNIIHRDIKPANVLLQNNIPRLTDFGISRAMATAELSSSIVGTENYMSPEAFEGVRSAQTDFWSVGVLLYRLVAGYQPFPQGNPTETMYAVLHKAPAPLPPDVPEALAAIIFKALEKDLTTNPDPPRRYQTAAAMRDDLQNFLETYSASFEDEKTVNLGLVQTDEEIQTRVKIPVPVKRADFWQNLVRQPVSPLTVFLSIGGLSLFAFVGFYLLGSLFSSEAENTNSSNAAIANFTVNQTPANNRPSNSDRSAFDLFEEGNKQYNRKRYDRAIEAYTKAIEINPSDYTFYNNRGLAFYKKRDYDAAVSDFNRAVELNPSDSLTYSNRGVAFEDSGNIEQAIADYRKAVEIDPNDKTARNNLNKILK